MGTAASIANLAPPYINTRQLGTSYLKSLKPELQVQIKNILFVTSEYSELIKAGGLGDVSSALPRALLKRNDVRIIIPGTNKLWRAAIPSQWWMSCLRMQVCRHAKLVDCKLITAQLFMW